MIGDKRIVLYARGSRFVVCSAHAAERLGGRVLSRAEAAGLIGDELRRGGSAAIRSLYAQLCVGAQSWSLNRISNEEVMRWLLRELDGWGPVRLVVVEPGSTPSFRAIRSETVRILEALADRLGHEDLRHDGRRYRVAGASSPGLRHEFYEVLPTQEAQALLASMATDTARPAALCELLRKAAILVTSREGPSDMVLLRRIQSDPAAAQVSEPPPTPAQVKPVRRIRPTDWVEIRFVDDAGAPLANEPYQIELPDGSIHTGTLDGNGSGFVDGFIPGSCEVSFPSFRPRLAS